MSALRLGTRKSALALAQSQLVAEAITATTGAEVTLVPITTHGDVTRDSLASIGGTGVFVSALRDALLVGEIDLAVHSLKDLPTAPDNMKTALIMDQQFWADKGEELRERFNAWLAQ